MLIASTSKCHETTMRFKRYRNWYCQIFARLHGHGFQNSVHCQFDNCCTDFVFSKLPK